MVCSYTVRIRLLQVHCKLKWSRFVWQRQSMSFSPWWGCAAVKKDGTVTVTRHNLIDTVEKTYSGIVGASFRGHQWGEEPNVAVSIAKLWPVFCCNNLFPLARFFPTAEHVRYYINSKFNQPGGERLHMFDNGYEVDKQSDIKEAINLFLRRRREGGSTPLETGVITWH